MAGLLDLIKQGIKNNSSGGKSDGPKTVGGKPEFSLGSTTAGSGQTAGQVSQGGSFYTPTQEEIDAEAERSRNPVWQDKRTGGGENTVLQSSAGWAANDPARAAANQYTPQATKNGILSPDAVGYLGDRSVQFGDTEFVGDLFDHLSSQRYYGDPNKPANTADGGRYIQRPPGEAYKNLGDWRQGNLNNVSRMNPDTDYNSRIGRDYLGPTGWDDPRSGLIKLGLYGSQNPTQWNLNRYDYDEQIKRLEAAGATKEQAEGVISRARFGDEEAQGLVQKYLGALPGTKESSPSSTSDEEYDNWFAYNTAPGIIGQVDTPIDWDPDRSSQSGNDKEFRSDVNADQNLLGGSQSYGGQKNYYPTITDRPDWVGGFENEGGLLKNDNLFGYYMPTDDKITTDVRGDSNVRETQVHELAHRGLRDIERNLDGYVSGPVFGLHPDQDLLNDTPGKGTGILNVGKDRDRSKPVGANKWDLKYNWENSPGVSIRDIVSNPDPEGRGSDLEHNLIDSVSRNPDQRALMDNLERPDIDYPQMPIKMNNALAGSLVEQHNAIVDKGYYPIGYGQSVYQNLGNKKLNNMIDERLEDLRFQHFELGEANKNIDDNFFSGVADYHNQQIENSAKAYGLLGEAATRVLDHQQKKKHSYINKVRDLMSQGQNRQDSDYYYGGKSGTAVHPLLQAAGY